MISIPVWKVDEQGIPDNDDLDACVRTLREGGVVGLPTETVYGLAGDVARESSLEKLFTIKGRDAEKTLPVQVADIAQVAGLVEGRLSDEARKLLEQFSPGPLTLVVRARPSLPPQVQGPGGSVGIRIPDQPAALAVLRRFGSPLAVTSANRSGDPAATDAAGALAALGDRIDGLVDGGPCRIGMPSTVVSLMGDRARILREGAIPSEAIRAAIAR